MRAPTTARGASRLATRPLAEPTDRSMRYLEVAVAACALVAGLILFVR